ncbi:hypothetical protein Afil01_64660 [Actinorhabdospora filicis]|uniref:HMA domain-containing protein n=1 Tax=Actinorhabdospora filicis TaxID=1785913 RepID=A0A9W6SRM9_9ACTN|nr:heavy metal-associated domain-containing protein [Actinorhabdospora filicis]GLZ81659.1 hypothetical protein Afil01_64660 [Actinorhabdospora filicis]
MITVDYSLTVFRVAHLSTETCEACADAIRVAVIRVPGVVGVDVNKAGGSLSVLTDGPVPASLIDEAIDEAGCHGLFG